MHYQLGRIYEQMKRQRINEALGLGSFNYTVPEDPVQKVYDFYYPRIDTSLSTTSSLLFIAFRTSAIFVCTASRSSSSI